MDHVVDLYLSNPHRDRCITASPLDLVRERAPKGPVVLIRPTAVRAAARWFKANFEGEVFYAVKANPSPWMINAVAAAGVTAFDVASIAEIELVATHAPSARMAFMHPVKSRSAIARAYRHYGVRTFALDTFAELEKIIAATVSARDINLIVRIQTDAPGAAYALSGKFGAGLDDAPALLTAAKKATSGQIGVSFHVGSQCMRPSAFEAAMMRVSVVLESAGLFADVVDVGGGFPSIYPGMEPPELASYMDVIHGAFASMRVHSLSELWCEPGRALSAEGSSLLAQVELRKGDALYINDGAYGSLFDAAHVKWPYPVKLVRADGGAAEMLKPFQFFGPTCDSIDFMPGPFWLPEDTREGDFVEIGMIGAYGVAMTTNFNGFGAAETIEVSDAPMFSLYENARSQHQGSELVQQAWRA